MPTSAACRAAQAAGYVSTTPWPGGGSRRAGGRSLPPLSWQRHGSTAPNSRSAARRLLIAASASAAAATGTSVARPRSADVLGVVILDAGMRSPAADDLLLSVASMYGRVTRREVVAVANTATLEAAVRGCMEDGATKVMIVPYCSSHRVQPETNPALALADVQSRLPGIRCMMGDTIAMDELLVEFIEGQVKVVEGRRDAVPERWFEPAQQPASQAAPHSDSLHTSSSLSRTEEWQGSSGGTAAAEPRQVWSDAAAMAQEQAGGSSAGFGSSAGSSGSAPPNAWSDDMASVLVVDYRDASDAAAGSSAGSSAGSAAPAEPAAEAAATLRSSIVGSSFDMGDAAGSSSGEDDWSSYLSHLSGYSSGRSGSDSDGESGGSSGGSVANSSAANGSLANGSLANGGSSKSFSCESFSTAIAGQPLYEDALEQRLCRMEEQLHHITTLLESQPPAQQAQQAPAWQSAMFEQQVREAAELVETEVEATLYSPQQLQFLARKRAAKRARTGRP